MTTSAYNRLRRRVAKATCRELPKPPSASGPNLTEQAFNRQALAGAGRFVGGDRKDSFAITRLGSRYTPDFRWEFRAADGSPRTVMVEVKGAYRSAKDAGLIERRSRLAWEVAADRHPEFVWVWAKLLRRGEWLCELYDPSEMEAKAVKAVCRDNADFLKLLEEGLK